MKQKIFTLLFAVAASIGTMFADSGTCGPNLTWNLSGTTLTISGTGVMNDYDYCYGHDANGFYESTTAPWGQFSGNITSVVINTDVTSIGAYAFYKCTGLTSVTIPNSVTSIGDYAFARCSSLTSVTIPNSVTSIGEVAFSGCKGLTSVTIGNSVTSIGNSAFEDCYGLNSIEIPNSVTSIGKWAFKWCTSLTSVTMGNSVTSIGDEAFMSCSVLTSVTIGNSVTSIGIGAFNGCIGLTSLIIGNSVTSIGELAFYKCSGLTSVTIPNSVTSIGEKAFYYCTGLTSVTIGNSVTSIEDYTFYQCTGLTSIELPNSVTSIGSYAFNSCIGLTSLTIGNSVTSIGDYAFYQCSSLRSVALDADALVNKTYTSSSSIKDIFGEQVTEYIIGNSVTSIGNYAFCNCTGLTSVTIGNSVTSIGDYAFYNCKGLTSVTIPESVTSIGGRAFDWCTGLTSVTIPNSVTSIGTYAFEYCKGLTSVTIGNSVTSIGIGAFNGCSGLTTVTIGNSVTSIGGGAFFHCYGLDSITCYPAEPPALGSDVFSGVRCSQIPLYVPGKGAAQYRVTDIWKNFDIRLLNCIVNASAINGIVEGAGEYEGYSDITLKVIPEDGYIFKQWSDGNKQNPRTIAIRQDTIFTALCEEYQEPANTDLPYNEPFTSSIGRFSISDVNTDGLSYVWTWASANYGMKASAYVSKTSHATESWLISPPISLMNASNIVLSFQHAVNKGTPTNLSVKISTDLGTTWSNLPVSNWPAGTNWNFVSASESLDAYANNTVQIAFVYVSTTSDCPTWEIKNFSITGTIAAVEPMPITVDASETTAAVTWLEVTNAVTYELIIYDSNWNVICVIVFDSEGHLLNITNDAPARDKLSQQEQTGGFAYSIAGLNSGTEYNYMLVAKDNNDKMVTSYSGSFKTTGSATALEEVDDHLLQSNPTQCTKVLRDGQIFILRGDKTYTLQGQEVK